MTATATPAWRRCRSQTRTIQSGRWVRGRREGRREEVKEEATQLWSAAVQAGMHATSKPFPSRLHL